MYIYVTYIYIYNVFGRGAGLERAGDISRDAGWPIRTFDWRTIHKLTCLVFGTNLSTLDLERAGEDSREAGWPIRTGASPAPTQGEAVFIQGSAT